MKLIKADALKIEQKKADFWRHTKSVGEGPLLLKCPEKLTFDPIAANVRFPPILSLSASGPNQTFACRTENGRKEPTSRGVEHRSEWLFQYLGTRSLLFMDWAK